MGSCSEDMVTGNIPKVALAKPASCDKPLPLIEFIPDEELGDGKSTVQLNKEVLASIIKQAGGRPVSIFCTTGPRRQGVSFFLLDFMIRKLEALEKGEPDKKWNCSDKKDENSKGLRFRNVAKLEVPEISIWSRPFIVKNEDGKEIAVLVMDAQGFDDYVACKDKILPIMALSLLTSSVMVCNLLAVVQEDWVSSMATYTRYGNLALDHVKNCTPFQDLVLFIRDWIHPDEYLFGWHVGEAFVKDMLKRNPNQSTEFEQVRESIGKCFDKLDCFLMPAMGEQDRYPDLPTDDSRPEMIQSLEEFVNGLINRSTLATKKILGNEVTGEDLLAYLEGYVDIFNSRENPSAETLWEATNSIHLSQLLQKVPKLNEVIEEKLLSTEHKLEISRFIDKMKKEIDENQKRMQKIVEERLSVYEEEMKKLGESKEFLPEEDLKEAHKRLQKEAFQEFEKTDKMPDNLVDFKMKLKEGFQEQFGKFKAQNVARRESTLVAAKGNVKKCYEIYLDTLKSKMENLHEEASQLSKQTFFENCPAKEIPGFVEEHEKQLEEIMNGTFKNLNQVLQLENISPEHRQNEKAKSLMEECAQASVTQIRNAFPDRVKFWMMNVLNPDSIAEMRAIYFETLNGAVEEYRDVVSAKLWTEFVRNVNDQYKAEYMTTLETILVLVQNVKESLHATVQLLDQNVSIGPTELKQIAKSELQKITADENYKDILVEALHLATDRLLGIYENLAFEKIASQKTTQVLQIYNQNMQSKLEGDVPFCPKVFEQFHFELMVIAMSELKVACGEWSNVPALTEKISFLKENLIKAFECHKLENESKLEKRRALTEKIYSTLKKQYNERIWEILYKNPKGLDIKGLEKFHANIQAEIRKLLEIEIRQKIGLNEPLEKHCFVLEAHMDLYWLTIVSMNEENVRKTQIEKEKVEQEREVLIKAQQELLNKCDELEAQSKFSSPNIKSYVTKSTSDARLMVGNGQYSLGDILKRIQSLKSIQVHYNRAS